MVGVVGHMSGGKSYFAVECILQWLCSGHVVATNIALNCRGVTQSTGIPCLQWKQLYYFLSDDPRGYHQLGLSDYGSWPMGSPRGSPSYDRDLVYIVLDEASSVFDSMVHASDSSIQAVATWARHTRKRGQEVYLIMQFASELHKRLRVHITEYVSCVNTSSIKIPLLGCRLPSFLRGFSVRQMYLQDAETPVGASNWVAIKPYVYQCYNTGQIVVGSQIGTGVSVAIDVTAREIRQEIRGLSCLLSLLLIIAAGLFSFLLVSALPFL